MHGRIKTSSSILRKHPYISATLIATLLAIAVWFAMPKEYTAITKLSDEYKEVDLAIGLDRIQARLNELHANDGINDMEVYCKILKTEDFARVISHKQVPGKGMDYGHWVMQERYFWQTDDTIEAIQDQINYNYSNKHETLTISFSDRDATVAAVILDSVTKQLQSDITMVRHSVMSVTMNDTQKELSSAAIKYHNANDAYASFVDSHMDSSLKQYSEEKKHLEDEKQIAYKHYDEMAKKYARYLAIQKKSYCSFAIIKANQVPRETNSYLLPYILVFILSALVFVKTYKLFLRRRAERFPIEWGGIFSPWSITMLVWGGMALLFMFSGDILDPLTEQFYISIALWVPIMVVTSFATFNLLEHKTHPLPTKGIEINKGIFYLLFVIAVVLSPMYLYRVWEIISSFDSEDMMKNARLLAVFGEGYGFLNYAVVVAQSLLLVSLWRYPKMPWWQLAAIIACCLINSLAVMEKGSTFLVVLCSMYVLFERRVVGKRTISLVIIMIIVFFYFVNLMREGEDSDYSQNESLFDFIGTYIMSPPVAYCTILRDIGNQFGTNTFETIYLFLDRFGLGHYEIHEKLQDFVYVPIPTNVYTVMQPFFRDFGYLGVAFFAWLYGMVSGVLYRYSCNGNVLCICIYTYFVEILVLQFFQENIFLSLVFVIQMIFFVFLMTQDKIKLQHVFSRKQQVSID